MAVREIVVYPQGADVLRAESKPAGGISRRVRRLVRDLKDTLLAHPEGVGLAAPQIGTNSRVVVVRLGSQDEDRELAPPVALIDPTIVDAGDEKRDFDGCLSLPGLYGETVRPHHLRVTGLDESGCPFDEVFDGFDAVVVHHEIDHLHGVLFIDRIERAEDLYRVQENEDGELVRVPFSSRADQLSD